MKQADDIISASPTKVLHMGNVEGSQVTREVMQEIRRVTARTGRHKIQKMAAVGVTGMKKIFFDAVVAMFDRSGTEIRSFKTEEEALDWLSE